VPPLPSVSGVVRVSVGYAIQLDKQAGFRFFLQFSDGPLDALEANTWATGVIAAATSLAPQSSNTITYNTATVQDLTSDLGVGATATGEHVGTLSGAPLPANASAVAEHQIARHYRGGKPKCFVPFGHADSLATDRTWLAASQAAFQSAWTAFLAAAIAARPIAISSATQVSVSYYKGSSAYDVGSGEYVRGKTRLTPRVGGPIVDPVISSNISPNLGSQRRRIHP